MSTSSNAEFEGKHPRRAGKFSFKKQDDPGTGVITAAVPHQHEAWQIREGATNFYCAACGVAVRDKVSAVGWEGEPIPACPMVVVVQDPWNIKSVIAFDAAPILAALSLDERRQVLAGDPAAVYRTAAGQFVVDRTGHNVTVTNTDEVTAWVESNRGACLAGDGWRETHGQNWTAVTATDELTWLDAANRAYLHTARAVEAGKFAVLIRDGDDFEIVPCEDLAAATDHVKAAGFYSAGFQSGGGTPFAYTTFPAGDGTGRTATMYFPKEGTL